MPDVVLSDAIVGGGTINTTLSATQLEVSGSSIVVSTSIEATQVVLVGEYLYLRLRVRWNGGGDDPTVLEVIPAEWTPNDTIHVLYEGNADEHEFKIEIESYSSGTKSARVFPESAAEVKQIQVTGFASAASPTAFQRITFIPKDAGGTAIYPSANDECWLFVIFA